jgi:beta-galactosidase
VRDASIDIRAEIDGPAEIAAFGSANPRAVGSFTSGETHVFQGQALLVLGSTGSEGGVRVRVSGGELTPGEVIIHSS